ncbi:Bax inhibitor-1/YccA family protein, partial [uncultured Actinomyces sp.]
QYGQAAGYGQVSPEQLAGLEAQYQAPSATNADMRRMTYDDVIIRTAGMFAIILALGALSWSLVTSTDESTAGLGVIAMLVGVIGGLVLGLVNAFKREPSPALILAYAAFEGLFLGSISGFMEARYEGIVVQAVLATLATFGVMLAAYSYGGFRVQGRFRRVVVVATLGYGVFCLINLGLSMTGVVGGAWGLRSMTIMGIPLGVPLGILAVILASLFLAIDFESIENGVRNGLPQRYAWAASFGLVVTIVWLYVEFLRLLSYFRD